MIFESPIVPPVNVSELADFLGINDYADLSVPLQTAIDSAAGTVSLWTGRVFGKRWARFNWHYSDKNKYCINIWPVWQVEMPASIDSNNYKILPNNDPTDKKDFVDIELDDDIDRPFVFRVECGDNDVEENIKSCVLRLAAAYYRNLSHHDEVNFIDETAILRDLPKRGW